MITLDALGKFLGSSTDFPLMEPTLNRVLNRAFFGRADHASMLVCLYRNFFHPWKRFSFLGGATVTGVVRKGVGERGVV